jgi:hypothetical protein
MLGGWLFGCVRGAASIAAASVRGAACARAQLPALQQPTGAAGGCHCLCVCVGGLGWLDLRYSGQRGRVVRSSELRLTLRLTCNTHTCSTHEALQLHRKSPQRCLSGWRARPALDVSNKKRRMASLQIGVPGARGLRVGSIGRTMCGPACAMLDGERGRALAILASLNSAVAVRPQAAVSPTSARPTSGRGLTPGARWRRRPGLPRTAVGAAPLTASQPA